MSETKTIRVKASTLNRLSKHVEGFETPDEVMNHILDLVEANQKLAETLVEAVALKKLEGEKQP